MTTVIVFPFTFDYTVLTFNTLYYSPHLHFLHRRLSQRLLELLRKLRGQNGQVTRALDGLEIAVQIRAWFMHKSRTQKC